MIEFKTFVISLVLIGFYCIYLRFKINFIEKKLRNAEQRIKILSIDVAGLVGSKKARAQVVLVSRDEFLKNNCKADLGPITGI